ncbi:uncharacterized protein HMPREF1541_07105 [Cyphellophora europaea CBS 101466]|uniref:F-box domain-containing protein n=1 Tax=Cyphellophora europaea (strain CBS 101466) TaxID=1220924 RepID=W2RP73_CYPE1|nr:uncharacterized protein HMPREF1541_07105 [Cyphellophora europaea CBS 101466]ETN37483.1 hypothetical protein HMPREF1541_07105 [Cyphellophora europaea CBS 101466]
MPATDLVQQGKSAYQQGRYDEASKSFAAAAASAAKLQDRIFALDLQIGAMVKLKAVDPALDVAKSVIRANRKDCRGYIRAAQIERLANRPQAAVRWYHHGLKHVSPSDALYPSLQSGLKKCQALSVAQTMASRPCDPFASLPLEIANMVLQHFDYRQMVAILRVSRGWRSFVSKEPLITDTIDFSKARNKVTIAAFRACLRRLTGYPSSAYLTNLTDPALKDMQVRLPTWQQRNTLISYATDSRELALIPSHLPKDPKLVSLEVSASLRNAIDTVVRCHRLKRLTISCPYEPVRNWVHTWEVGQQHAGLEHLQIVANSLQPQVGIADLALPNLRSLNLCGFQIPNELEKLTSLEELHLKNCAMTRAIDLPTALKDLSFTNMKYQFRAGDKPNPELHLPDLVHLRAQMDAWDISWSCLGLDLNSIQSLDVQDNRLTEEQALIFSKMPRLRRLILRDARLLTACFVKDLLEASSHHIEYIGLSNCDNLDPGTAAWAKLRYNVKVDIRTIAWDDGGRRIAT